MSNLPDGCSIGDIDDAAEGRYGRVWTWIEYYDYCVICDNPKDYCGCDMPELVTKRRTRYENY